MPRSKAGMQNLDLVSEGASRAVLSYSLIPLHKGAFQSIHTRRAGICSKTRGGGRAGHDESEQEVIMAIL